MAFHPRYFRGDDVVFFTAFAALTRHAAAATALLRDGLADPVRLDGTAAAIRAQADAAERLVRGVRARHGRTLFVTVDWTDAPRAAAGVAAVLDAAGAAAWWAVAGRLRASPGHVPGDRAWAAAVRLGDVAVRTAGGLEAITAAPRAGRVVRARAAEVRRLTAEVRGLIAEREDAYAAAVGPLFAERHRPPDPRDVLDVLTWKTLYDRLEAVARAAAAAAAVLERLALA